MTTQQRIETIKAACLKVIGPSCLNAKKPTINKADKALLKLIDSVEKSEYIIKQAEKLEFSELDFN